MNLGTKGIGLFALVAMAAFTHSPTMGLEVHFANADLSSSAAVTTRRIDTYTFNRGENYSDSRSFLYREQSGFRSGSARSHIPETQDGSVATASFLSEWSASIQQDDSSLTYSVSSAGNLHANRHSWIPEWASTPDAGQWNRFNLRFTLDEASRINLKVGHDIASSSRNLPASTLSNYEVTIAHTSDPRLYTQRLRNVEGLFADDIVLSPGEYQIYITHESRASIIGENRVVGISAVSRSTATFEAEIVPIPTPAACIPLALCGLGVCARRRR